MVTDGFATLQRIATHFLILSPYARAGEINRIIRCNVLHVLQAVTRQCHTRQRFLSSRVPQRVSCERCGDLTFNRSAYCARRDMDGVQLLTETRVFCTVFPDMVSSSLP